MENGLPRKRTGPPEKVKVSEILNFTSAILAVVVSAIFYFAGWIYVAHWYSFFGVDVTELNLSSQTILVHGIPGVFIIVLTGLVTASIYAIAKFASQKKTVIGEDFPNIVVSAYVFSVIILLLLWYTIYRSTPLYSDNGTSFLLSTSNLPVEAKISMTGLLVLILFFGLSEQLVEIFTGPGITVFRAGRISFGFYPGINWIRLIIGAQAIYEVIRDAIRKPKIEEENERSNLIFFRPKNLWLEIENREDKLKNSIAYQQSNIKGAVIQTWQFWVGAFIILFFLVSISVSSILGEWDARMGRKTMIGGWQGTETYIYVKRSVELPLPINQAESSSSSNIYGPLIILGKNGDTYYLTDWVDQFPYAEKPNTYIVKLAEDSALGVMISPSTSFPTIVPHTTETPTRVPPANVILTPMP